MFLYQVISTLRTETIFIFINSICSCQDSSRPLVEIVHNLFYIVQHKRRYPVEQFFLVNSKEITFVTSFPHNLVLTASYRKRIYPALTGVAQWIKCQPVNQRSASSSPSQGTCLGCEPGPQQGMGERQPHINVPLLLFLSLFPSLKINK